MAENVSSATYFRLRWESTGDKWWYASPIDCAAANGHYDLVRELIRLDANHLISLTSLRRLRRLEFVWDESGDSHFSGTAKSRSTVARRLLQDSDVSFVKNYGGWLLYTAASAGDLEFVKELLAGDPLLVFGEGEYGLTDMLYAGARSQNPEVFWNLYDFAAEPRFEGFKRDGEVPDGFKSEVMNRAVHAAARGGNSVVLAELLSGSENSILSFRDAYGATVLHAAACRGQVKVVKYLIATYEDTPSATDNEGNTALHVAAYKGQLSIVEVLLTAFPSSIIATNKAGNTLLHMAVAGALSPGFQRLDHQIELTKQLITTRNKFGLENIINAKNNEGQTVLHMAILGNVHSDLVELLMAARYINVNVRDDHGMTPLDYLRHQPKSSSSEMLMRQLISAGGMSNCHDYSVRKAFASHLRTQGEMCSSPGTSFRVLDSEIFKHSGLECILSRTEHRGITTHPFSTPTEIISQCSSNSSEIKKRVGAVENAAKKLKIMFQWSKKTKTKKINEAPVPLRERFLCPTSKNKRTLAVRSNISSPINRKKFASGVLQGVVASSSSSISKTSISSYSEMDKRKGAADDMTGSSFSVQDEADETPKNKLMMNQYLCFGGSRLCVKNSIGRRQHPSTNSSKPPIQTVAC